MKQNENVNGMNRDLGKSVRNGSAAFSSAAINRNLGGKTSMNSIKVGKLGGATGKNSLKGLNINVNKAGLGGLARQGKRPGFGDSPRSDRSS